VDADAGALAAGVEARQLRGGLHVRRDAAHGVVHRRADRDRLLRRVDAKEHLGQLVDHRQALGQLLAAQMHQLQMHHMAELGLDRAALALLMPEGLAEAVAGAELHGLGRRLVDHGAERVILQVAVAVLVHQPPALAAAALGDQDARARQRGRVILHELHVAQRRAVAIGQPHAVAGHGAGVGVLAIDAPGAAGGHDHRLRLDAHEIAVAISMATSPWQRPSSTSRSTAKYSSRR
jgi:hypothetical protein